MTTRQVACPSWPLHRAVLGQPASHDIWPPKERETDNTLKVVVVGGGGCRSAQTADVLTIKLHCTIFSCGLHTLALHTFAPSHKPIPPLSPLPPVHCLEKSCQTALACHYSHLFIDLANGVLRTAHNVGVHAVRGAGAAGAHRSGVGSRLVPQRCAFLAAAGRFGDALKFARVDSREQLHPAASTPMRPPHFVPLGVSTVAPPQETCLQAALGIRQCASGRKSQLPQPPATRQMHPQMTALLNNPHHRHQQQRQLHPHGTAQLCWRSPTRAPSAA